MPAKPAQKRMSDDRLTISLGPGQREALKVFAKHTNAALSFVVRTALDEFIRRHTDRQLPLPFPRITRSGEPGDTE